MPSKGNQRYFLLSPTFVQYPCWFPNLSSAAISSSIRPDIYQTPSVFKTTCSRTYSTLTTAYNFSFLSSCNLGEPNFYGELTSGDFLLVLNSDLVGCIFLSYSRKQEQARVRIHSSGSCLPTNGTLDHAEETEMHQWTRLTHSLLPLSLHSSLDHPEFLLDNKAQENQESLRYYYYYFSPKAQPRGKVV